MSLMIARCSTFTPCSSTTRRSFDAISRSDERRVGKRGQISRSKRDCSSDVCSSDLILTPPWHMKPGVIALPLEARTELEITLVANLISLTPGTLSLDVSDDRKVLYIHAMFLDDEEELRRNLKIGRASCRQARPNIEIET